jgi:peptide subunit release factor 1 (eRF1)
MKPEKSKNFLTCPKCNSELKKVEVEIEDAKTPAISYQCENCDYYNFEPESTLKVIKEINEKEASLKIKQKIIKLSSDRLGMYFNKDVIDCLNLKSGEEILVSIPNKKRIVLDLVK